MNDERINEYRTEGREKPILFLVICTSSKDEIQKMI